MDPDQILNPGLVTMADCDLLERVLLWLRARGDHDAANALLTIVVAKHMAFIQQLERYQH